MYEVEGLDSIDYFCNFRIAIWTFLCHASLRFYEQNDVHQWVFCDDWRCFRIQTQLGIIHNTCFWWKNFITNEQQRHIYLCTDRIPGYCLQRTMWNKNPVKLQFSHTATTRKSKQLWRRSLSNGLFGDLFIFNLTFATSAKRCSPVFKKWQDESTDFSKNLICSASCCWKSKCYRDNINLTRQSLSRLRKTLTVFTKKITQHFFASRISTPDCLCAISPRHGQLVCIKKNASLQHSMHRLWGWAQRLVLVVAQSAGDRVDARDLPIGEKLATGRV